MRSFLFVPADSAEKTRQGHDERRRRADRRPRGFDRARRQSARAAKRGGVPQGSARATTPRPYLLVRVNSLQTGLTDADLDAVAPAKPDAIMLPKAEGGASVIHADAKLAVREAQSGLPDGHIKIVAIATETAAALFRRRHLSPARARG